MNINKTDIICTTIDTIMYKSGRILIMHLPFI